jgi:hypothetical protein
MNDLNHENLEREIRWTRRHSPFSSPGLRSFTNCTERRMILLLFDIWKHFVSHLLCVVGFVENWKCLYLEVMGTWLYFINNIKNDEGKNRKLSIGNCNHMNKAKNIEMQCFELQLIATWIFSFSHFMSSKVFLAARKKYCLACFWNWNWKQMLVVLSFIVFVLFPQMFIHSRLPSFFNTYFFSSLSYSIFALLWT